MSSGLHFTNGVPLVGSASLTPSDIDTSQAGIRLANTRSLLYVSDTAPTNLDGPDWQRLTWSAPTSNNLFRKLYFYDGVSWVSYAADIDLSAATPNTLPVNALDVTSGSLGQVATIVNTVDGLRSAWKTIPLPYNIGANGTCLFSSGANALFRFVEGEDVKSTNAGTNVYPLVSDGTGSSSFRSLPPSAITTPSGTINLLVSRASGAYASSILLLSELSSDSDLVGTHVAAGYIPQADGAGNITWVNKYTNYETIATVLLSTFSTIVPGNYVSKQVDSIPYTTQKPITFNVYLQCIFAEQGYAVGDRIPVSAVLNNAGTRGGTFKVNYNNNYANVSVTLFGKYAEYYTEGGTISTVLLSDNNWKFVVTTNKI